MGRKFESELGKRVVEKSGRKLGKKTSALVGAVAICTLMISCALISSASQPAKDSGIVFEGEVDYIYGADEEVDLKRTMTLKNKTMISNGESESTYTTFNYSVSLSVKEAGIVGMDDKIGSLEIAFDDDPSLTGEYDVVWELIGDGIQKSEVSGAVSGTAEGIYTVEFGVPFEVVPVDSKLTLNVTLTFDVGFLSGSVTEGGDLESTEDNDPDWEYTGRFDPVESYPGPQWLF